MQLADLQTNFVLFSIPFFDIEFLVSFPGFYIPFDLLSLFFLLVGILVIIFLLLLTYFIIKFLCYHPFGFFVNSFSLESVTGFRLRRIVGYYRLHHSMAYHQLLSTYFSQL